MTLHQPSQSDGRRRIVLIGGGPSCVSVLCRLADRIAAAHHGIGVGIGSGIARWPMGEILLIDQQGETGGGRPHAAGVGSALLLNDSVAEIDATGIGLTMWL